MAIKIDNSKSILRLANFLGCSALRLIFSNEKSLVYV